MSRNDNYRRGNKGRNWNNKNNGGKFQNDYRQQESRQSNEFKRNYNPIETQKEVYEKENAIREFKSNVTICEICEQPITDISSAILNKNSKNPVHFDCVLSRLAQTEKIGPNDRITYIGNGNFAILHFENIHDMRHFILLYLIFVKTVCIIHSYLLLSILDFLSHLYNFLLLLL